MHVHTHLTCVVEEFKLLCKKKKKKKKCFYTLLLKVIYLRGEEELSS